MRLLVTGARVWEGPEAYKIMEAALAFLRPGDVLVHGGAKGADSMAQSIAESLGYDTLVVDGYATDYTTNIPDMLKIEIYRPDWSQGRVAAIFRNQDMVDTRPDRCYAFIAGESRGTRDCIRRAHQANIPITIFEV